MEAEYLYVLESSVAYFDSHHLNSAQQKAKEHSGGASSANSWSGFPCSKSMSIDFAIIIDDFPKKLAAATIDGR